jgi:hypothetical protein
MRGRSQGLGDLGDGAAERLAARIARGRVLRGTHTTGGGGGVSRPARHGELTIAASWSAPAALEHLDHQPAAVEHAGLHAPRQQRAMQDAAIAVAVVAER